MASGEEVNVVPDVEVEVVADEQTRTYGIRWSKDGIETAFIGSICDDIVIRGLTLNVEQP